MNIHKFRNFQAIIIFCVLTISFSYEIFRLDQEIVTKTYRQKQLLLKLEYTIKLKNYLMIKVKGLESDLTSHIIEYCNSESCENIIQLSHNQNPINYLWITQEQIKEDNFIKITSTKEERDYEVEIATTDKVNMFKNSEYTYYVSENNQKMIFNFLQNEENIDSFNNISIWITGENIDNIEINSEIINYIKKDGKNIYNLQIRKNVDIEVKVEAKKGSLLSISSILVNNSNYSSPILLNSKEVYGYLNNSEDLNRNKISTEDKIILLTENQMFNHYIQKDNTQEYTISINQENESFNLTIDLMIHSGDVIFNNINKEIANNTYIYQAANKISNTIYDISSNSMEKDFIDFKVKAKKNSYYSIKYRLIRENNKNKEYISPGVNHLITIEPFVDKYGNYFNEEKNLSFYKTITNDEYPFFIYFYSINCEFFIYKYPKVGEKVLLTKDYYFNKDIINSTDLRYNDKYYDYFVEIDKMEPSLYNRQVCMLYTSSTEFQKEILISDNVLQKVYFKENNYFIKYLYVISNIDDNIGITFVLNVKAEYNIYFNIDKNNIKNITLNKSQQVTIYSNEYNQKCEINQDCRLIVGIELIDFNETDNPNLEVTIKSLGLVDKYPSYIIKNKIYNDYLNVNNTNYYYTDIGIGWSGEIFINYYRGNGRIYGKIVKKNKNFTDQNKEWMGIYDFPKTYNDSLPYYNHLKKMVYNKDDIENCQEGCLLLLTVENKMTSSISEGYEISRKIYFDILIKTKKIGYSQTANYILVPLETYIIGNIASEEIESDSKSFYVFTIPYDADSIVFDFQSEYAILNIQISNNIEKDWKFISRGKPGLYEIKKDILLKNTKKEKSIKGIQLLLSISAEKTDSIFSTVFALKIHLSKNDSINIHDVNSDQQTLCNLTEFNGKNKNFRCLFVVRYDLNNTLDNLYIYPLFEDLSSEYSIYADFIDEMIYDSNDIEQLKNLIPNKNSEFTTDDKREDILRIDFTNDRNKYVYVSVEANKPSIVKLLTTYSTYDYTSNPNPSTPQLYALKDKELKFEFSENDSLMLNFVGLFGSAKIYWKNEENITYHIGRNERLSLTSSNIKQKQNDNSKNILVIENLNEKEFIFYITYYLRSSEIVFDQLFLDNSFKLYYPETDFPITIYYKLNEISNYTNVFININSLEGNNVENSEENELQLFGWIYEDKDIFYFKSKKEFSPKKEKAIKGIYDPAKRVGFLSFKKDDFGEIIDNLNLLVKIDKNENSKIKYNSISLEGIIIQDESLIPITEKVYIHGKLKNGEEKMVYKLRVDKEQPTIVVFFSTNSDKLDFYLSQDKEGKLPIYSKIIQSNGRIISYITSVKFEYIYLTVFQKDKQKVTNEQLTNYAIKYINIYNESSLYLYETSMKVDFSNNKNNYKISMDCIKCDNCNVEYFVKFINRAHLINGESFNNIAIVESKGIVKKYDNDTKCNNGKVIIEEKDIKLNVSNIQVIGHIFNEKINEFISYDSIFIKEKKDYSKTNSIIIKIAIGLGCLLLIILFAFFYIKLSRKNYNLKKEIEKMSFEKEMKQEATSEEDKDQLATDLLMDD